VIYVFFETGNKKFFRKLMGVFCRNYVENIVGFYNSVKETRDDERWKIMKDHFAKVNFDIFNCANHLMSVNCPYGPCKAEHTAVLEFDQKTKYENTLSKTQCNYARTNYRGEIVTWRKIEGIFQYHKTVKMVFNVEFLLSFSSHGRNDFLNKYANETNKKELADGYYYVRAAVDSEYAVFMDRTRLENVEPCDALQSVVV